MENSSPKLAISKVPNFHLGFIKKFFFFFTVFFTLTNQSFAQGTTCLNATLVTVNGACRSNDNPTGSDSAPFYNSSCGQGNNSNDVGWYRFVVTGGPLNITITAVGNRNLAFQLIGSTTNNCSNLSEIQCVNNVNGSGNNNSTETLTTTLSNGTYFIKTLSSGGNNMTLASLCVTGIAPEYTIPTSGNNSITTCSGNLYDSGGSSGNYVNNSDGYTVINPSIPGNRVRVSGTINVEGAYDYMTIYDGIGTGGTVLWGGSPHGTSDFSCQTFTVPVTTSTTGSLTVRFYSDFLFSGCSGFNLAISCIAPAIPTITSFTPSTGCVGSSLTINGTNLSNASSVSIGGTAATITANTATSITVTVGNGTTGNISITTPGGTVTSTSSFTVLATPNISSQPTTPTSVCAGSGTRTISVIASNATTYQWRRNGVNISNTTPYSGVNTNTLTITNPALAIAGNFDVLISNGSCSVTSNSVPLTVISTPVITTNPSDSSITAGANTSFSVIASNNPTSYTWQVSTNGGSTWATVSNGGVYSGATTATLTITNATFGINGYRYRASATNSCGTSTYSSSALLTVALNYCTPSVSNGRETSYYITNVNFIGNITNSNNGPTTYSSSPRGYQDWTTLGSRATQAQGEGVNLFIDTNGGANFLKAWVDWNKDGTFDTSSEVVYQCTSGFLNTTFGFQVPANVTPGDYRIRLRINRSSGGSNTFGPCGNIDYNGETEDYLFTVVENCVAKITSISNGNRCGNGSVVLNAVGTSGTTQYRWYTSQTGSSYSATSSSTWITPSISTTTTYYVTAFNGTCESLFRTPVVATIKKVPALTFSNSNPEICGEDSILELSANGSSEQVFLVDESFEGSSYVFTNNQIASPDSSITNWQIRTSTYVPPYPTYPVWYPAISSGFGNNKFIMSTSDLVAGGTTSGKVNEALELTNSINTVGFTDLTLTFKIYFSSYYDANNANTEAVFIETNNGSGWSSTPVATYLADEGIGTKFVEKTINLNSFVDISNFKIRIRYRAGWCDGVAIDDVKIFGNRPLVPNFTWTSGYPIDAYVDLACTIPYTTGTPASTVYIKPTLAQLENANYSFTANANLTNGCTTSGTVNVTNKSKVWKGTVNSNWNDVDNWSPSGIPTSENCVVIPNNTTISGTNYNAYGKNLTVKNGGVLNVQPSNNLIITDLIKVESSGTFQLENNSNLVQINNVTNSGNIIYKRIANNIKGSDYIYWSSPVANQVINNIYTSPTQGPKYRWDTLLNNGNGASGNTSQGNWVNANGNTMATGSGYIIRGSSSFGMAATNINSTFTGRPNNGNITATVFRGSYTGVPYAGANGTTITNLDDNNNLLGNPYPSAINALQFLSDNSSVIEGNVKLWTHGTDPGPNNGTTISNPFYGTYSNNYSASDYMTINFTGSTSPAGSNIIKAGQAFFVSMKDGTTGSGSVIFNNNQRRDNTGTPYTNDNFFKVANNNYSTNFDDLERHRMWLEIMNSNNVSERTLVGYVQGATNNQDSFYDALSSPLTMGIYSFIGNESFIIQGRSLPFDDNDEVSIGFNVPSNGNYSIGINTADGLFLGTQDVYLKDELLNVYHDLKSTPYTFTATAGVHNNRFKLVYKTATVLSNETFNENEIQIAKYNNIIDIVSGNEIMDNVKVFDVRGRLLVEKTKINNNSISIDMNSIQDQVLIVNIITSEGIKVTRKIL